MSISRRKLLLAGGGTAALIGTGIRPGPATAHEPASVGAQSVVEWNQTVLHIVRTPGMQPATVHPTRNVAMMHTAMRDAIVRVQGERRGRLVEVTGGAGGTAAAAAARAAHDTLVVLYPNASVEIGQQLDTALARVHDPRARAAGQSAGAQAATLILAERAEDGSAATPPKLEPATLPGQYRPTPPTFADAVFTHWPDVTPFVLARANQFCPPPPPPLDSPRYAAAIKEVATIGQDVSDIRTTEQTAQARFWSAPIQNYWYEIAQGVMTANRLDLLTAAHVFNELSLTFADATIALYEAKYHHLLWRPVTAIRAQAESEEDLGWTPLLTTPNDPSYPSAHSVIAQAGATILTHHFGERNSISVHSEVTGDTRSFTSFQAAADEAGIARVLAGVHSRLDHESGQPLGHSVAQFVLSRLEPPIGHATGVG